MAGRVNLNLPPELIESARAFQFANREALSGRQAEQKIKRKVRERRESIIKTSQQLDGGSLDFKRLPTQRIWRRWRTGRETSVGVMWYSYNFTNRVNSGSNIVTPINMTESQHNTMIQAVQPHTYIYRTVRTEIGSFDFEHFAGSGNGTSWVTSGLSIPWESTVTETITEQWVKFSPDTYVLVKASSFETLEVNHTRNLRLMYFLLPAGNSRVLLGLVAKQYLTEGYGSGFEGNYPFTYSATPIRTDSIAWVASNETIAELSGAVPGFIESAFQENPFVFPHPMPQPVNGVLFYAPNGLIGTHLVLQPYNIGMRELPFQTVSSCVFDVIKASNSGGLSLQAIEDSFKGYTGDSSIPVLGYLGDLPQLGPTAMTGRFGIIPGATIYDPPPFFPVSYTWLDDSIDQAPGRNAITRGPLPTECIVAYDYHGGTYCKDKLAELGINL